MATYHLHVKNISRKRGRSAVAAAAYRAGETLWNEAEEKDSAFGGKRDVYATEIRCPAGAPAWMADRGVLWNKVEAAEVRKDSRLAKEIEFSLPRELPPSMWLEVARQMADLYVSRGHVVDVAIHEDGNGHNPHVHLLLTTRKVGPDGFGRKLREADGLEFVTAARGAWADIANAALGKVGSDARIDERSHAARGLDRKPTVHRGPDQAERRIRRWGRTGMDHDTLEARRELLAAGGIRERFPLLSARADWPPERREPVPGLTVPERGEWQAFWREIDERRWGPEVTPAERQAPNLGEDRVRFEARPGREQAPSPVPPPPGRENYYARIEEALPVWRELHAAVKDRMRADGFRTDHPLDDWQRVERLLRSFDEKLEWLHTQELARDLSRDRDDHPVPDPDGRSISPMQREEAEERMIFEARKPHDPRAVTPDPRSMPADERERARAAVERQNELPVRDDEADDHRLAPHESRLDWLDEPDRHEAPQEAREATRLGWLDDGPSREAERDREPERERER